MEQNNCNNTCFHAAIILITCKHKFGKCVVLKVEKPERIYDESLVFFPLNSWNILLFWQPNLGLCCTNLYPQ